MSVRIEEAYQAWYAYKQAEGLQAQSKTKHKGKRAADKYWQNKVDRRKNVPEKDVVIEILGFGNGKICFDRVEQYWKPIKSMEGFFYLLMNRNVAVPIKQIAMDLWPESSLENAKRNVRKIMTALRGHLKTISREQIKIIYLNDAYTLTFNNCYYDIEQFEKLYEILTAREYDKTNEEKTITLLYHVQEIYEGAYLSKHNFDWAQAYRQVLSEKYFKATLLLAEIHQNNANFKGLTACYDKLVYNGFFHRSETKQIRSAIQEQSKNENQSPANSSIKIAYK